MSTKVGYGVSSFKNGGIAERQESQRKEAEELRRQVFERLQASEQRYRDLFESANDQLRQSQKMEAVGRLAGGVAHDFNNMLTIILGHCSLIDTNLTPDTPIAYHAQAIRKAAERAATLTRQLLAFSRKQVLQPKVIDLNLLVINMESMLRRLIGEDIELITVSNSTPVWVKADPGQLEQVIMNLAVNARDAMTDGGKLTIETSIADVGEAEARKHNHDFATGSYASLAVKDNGCGMSAEILARIFEPFFTTKEQGKGTGLGLSTVYGIVQQSNGSIAVESKIHRGTAFKIYLPQIREHSETSECDQPKCTPSRGSETILLVEDEEDLRKLAAHTLKAKGFKVLEASDGQEALNMCERHDGRIDLLLTDVVMPRMNGRDLASRVAAMRPRMKVLYMSGYTDTAILPDGTIGAEAAFMQKPFTPDVLTNKIDAILNGAGA